MSFDPFQQAAGEASKPSPYRPPQGYPTQAPSGGTHSFEDLKQLAQYQRLLVGMVGLQLLFGCGGAMVVGAIASAAAQRGEPAQSIVGVIWWGLMFLIGIGAVVSLALVGNKIWGPAGAVICAVLGFFPCVSLITLLVANGSATSLLQKHGYKVGFLGCNDPRLMS